MDRAQWYFNTAPDTHLITLIVIGSFNVLLPSAGTTVQLSISCCIDEQPAEDCSKQAPTVKIWLVYPHAKLLHQRNKGLTTECPGTGERQVSTARLPEP